jgi:uncharacterized iron-regulated membrane protein
MVCTTKARNASREAPLRKNPRRAMAAIIGLAIPVVGTMLTRAVYLDNGWAGFVNLFFLLGGSSLLSWTLEHLPEDRQDKVYKWSTSFSKRKG